MFFLSQLYCAYGWHGCAAVTMHMLKLSCAPTQNVWLNPSGTCPTKTSTNLATANISLNQLAGAVACQTQPPHFLLAVTQHNSSELEEIYLEKEPTATGTG